MKPFDPRLLRYASASRSVFLLGGMLGLVRTLAILAWSWCLAQAITAVALPALGGFGGAAGRVAEGAFTPEQLPFLIGGGLLALCVRSLAAWGMDAVAARGAVRVKTQLRAAALDALDGRSPERSDGRSDAELATTLGRGLDALDGYFSGYVPQLVLTLVATPILVVAVLLADPISGITVLIVFPIIPVFMILIGMATQAVQDRQWAQLQRLSSSFLDAVSGLATLKIFGRERRQSARIAAETEEYRSRTMKVLRVTFLSGFVLDLAGTFSIALVAVTVGTRLVNGEFPLGLGLFVLLLLPEVFIPIRQVGAAFHASTEGLAASGEVFSLIEGNAGAGSGIDTAADPVAADPTAATDLSAGAPVSGASTVAPDGAVRFSAARIARGDRDVVGPVSFSVSPGEFVALAGPSGAGKSTLLGALLGFVPLSGGALERPAELAWTGQRAGLLQGTVAANVALGAEQADADRVRRALDTAGLPELPGDRELGAAGAGVSGGQAQRIAIARSLYRAWSLGPGTALLLDEPTSALDRATEARVCAALRAEAESGRPVLVVSHRQAVLDAADRVERITAATAQEGTR
ncbi:ATP-binding cassette subfamily C protein CydD [Leucobacter luti]|uniref:thiol reductant ABC exporter subunit CydD n=1 Tax=Leucobacter luti TaxID=340320 RepID=UPI0010476321|nr:thiol reductant ABC exporter subunit CydD [Leucobacter luti]MCW2287972.1 ATP-binding cassette subfamily C protein CydD [Leucobacter luti]TCK45866.1 ATP-binding cassette subfamily C protein CydD [Leucobacter luti]